MPDPILAADPQAAILSGDDSPATEALRLALSRSALPQGSRVVILGQPVLTLARALAQTPADTALTALTTRLEGALATRRAVRSASLLIAEEALAQPQALAQHLGLAADPLPATALPDPALPAPALPDPVLILLARHLIDRDRGLQALEQAIMAERSALAPHPPADPLEVEATRALAAEAAALRDRDARTIALLQDRCASGRDELEALARQIIALTERLEQAETATAQSLSARDRARADADQAIRDRDATRAELDRFYRSKSYRMTAPLRWLRRRLRKG